MQYAAVKFYFNFCKSPMTSNVFLIYCRTVPTELFDKYTENMPVLENEVRIRGSFEYKFILFALYLHSTALPNFQCSYLQY